MKCKNCARYVHVNEDNERTVGEPNWCFYISDSPCADLERDCKAFTPLRNADRFRAMTDYALARTFAGYCDCLACPPAVKTGDCEPTRFSTCVKNWLTWLQQEVVE